MCLTSPPGGSDAHCSLRTSLGPSVGGGAANLGSAGVIVKWAHRFPHSHWLVGASQTAAATDEQE